MDAVRAGCADPDPEVRASAASALGALARPEDLESALPVLTGMVMDVDADLAAAAELALEQDLLARVERRANRDGGVADEGRDELALGDHFLIELFRVKQRLVVEMLKQSVFYCADILQTAF